MPEQPVIGGVGWCQKCGRIHHALTPCLKPLDFAEASDQSAAQLRDVLSMLNELRVGHDREREAYLEEARAKDQLIAKLTEMNAILQSQVDNADAMWQQQKLCTDAERKRADELQERLDAIESDGLDRDLIT